MSNTPIIDSFTGGHNDYEDMICIKDQLVKFSKKDLKILQKHYGNNALGESYAAVLGLSSETTAIIDNVLHGQYQILKAVCIKYGKDMGALIDLNEEIRVSDVLDYIKYSEISDKLRKALMEA